MFIDSILYSYAQIFFSNRRWLGALILAVTMFFPLVGLMGLLGVTIANITAAILKFDQAKIRSGFYGFNGILFGVAAGYYYELSFFMILIIPVFLIITFFISAVLEHYLAVAFNLPGLSLPFIFSLYIFIIFLTNYGDIKIHHLSFPYDNLLASFPIFIKNYFKSLALIVFQPSVFAGIILSIGILIFSRILFVLSIVSYSLSAILLTIILPVQTDQLAILVGFNAILTAFALGGVLILPSPKSFFLMVISTLIVVIFTGFFHKLLTGTLLPLLVLPFNFIVLFTIYSLKFRKEQSELDLLYFTPGSPEENLYYHQNRKNRFDRFKYFYPELPFFGEWFVSQGFEGAYTHKNAWKYAWDFVVIDEKKSQFSNEGNQLTDYYCYKLPVSSPLDGKVVKVASSIPNNEVGDVNLDKNWGNTVIIDHGEGLFSAASHLDSDSIKLKENDYILKGDVIGLCGNSGRSPYPHIHFQYQLTDKIGDKTYRFPFAHFIEKREDKLIAKSFDYPKENSIIQNIVVHKTIKKAFGLRLGDKITLQCSVNENSFTEEWEVKVDIYNMLYIENDQKETAYIYLTDKVFYFSHYLGSKKSALYYFFLLAYQVPLCYHANLEWKDQYSLSQLNGTSIRYLTEFLLSFKNFIHAEGNFKYLERDEHSESFIIENKIELKGNGILSSLNKTMSGQIKISDDGKIDSFQFSSKHNYKFNATLTSNNGDLS